jgi:hypothetical protein
MDEIMNRLGSFYLKQRANKEISSAGDDVEVLIFIFILLYFSAFL